ncbi:MAG: DUF6516 family protein [Chloroflexi bacterium]|nr:DUF6516 family protein [Chloroflexota bacterium]
MSFSREEYENLLYALPSLHTEVAGSTLRLYANSATTALVRGIVRFNNGLELHVFEYLDLTDGELLDYAYEVIRGGEKIRWYDSQPHPEDASLQETFPHHYHEEPDMKHHRLPAHGISSIVPNLPTLVSDCVELGR